jgi:anti-sigma regulatory factor (Ser/Thr protein kinase)
MYLNDLMPDIRSLAMLTCKLLTDDVYSQETKMSDEEQQKARLVIYEKMLSTVTISFGFSTDSLPPPFKVSPLMRRLSEMLEPILPPKHFLDIRLALEEAVTNIAEHSYQNQSEQAEISFRFTITATDITIDVEDNGEQGRQYNFDNAGQYDSLEDLHKHAMEKRRGMGVFMIRRIMDEVEYSIEPGKRNRLRMRKNLRSTATAPEQTLQTEKTNGRRLEN